MIVEFLKLVPKKISEIKKRNMIECFSNGETIDQLSEKFQITKVTITRYLKKEFELKVFKNLVDKNNKNNKNNKAFENINKNLEYQSDPNEMVLNEQFYEGKSFVDPTFIEITPLNYEIDHEQQKELSSVSINEINLPKVVYMIVDNKIELKTKLLKDYPDWQFLSQSELERLTIEIYFDIKIAKRYCSKDQKVIKVPNTDVFSIVAPILITRGISRIVSPDKLIAL